VIVSFGDSGTEDLYNGVPSAKARAFPNDIIRTALRKLAVVNAATSLDDLSAVPGNQLEQLKGKLKGYHSIRINKQWRVVFKWDRGAQEVKVTDYH
jgi:toxin HigB-1